MYFHSRLLRRLRSPPPHRHPLGESVAHGRGSGGGEAARDEGEEVAEDVGAERDVLRLGVFIVRGLEAAAGALAVGVGV